MRRTLALLSALLVVGGCSDDGKQPPPAATVPSEAPTSSTAPPAPDPAVIPGDLAEIDEEYVQAVVDELFAVEAKAGEIFINTRSLDDEGITYLTAIYTEEELNRQLDIWFQDLASRHEDLLPGATRNEVQQVIDVAPDCVYVEVKRDYSETTVQTVAPRTIYLGLTSKSAKQDPKGRNLTAWSLFMDGLNPDGSRPENPCEGR